MRKKKILAMMLVAMLSLSGLTGCSDKDKEDMNNKLNNKTTETTKKDDSKADDKTSESTTEDKSDDKKSDSADNSASKPADDKKSDSNSGNTGSNSSANKPSNGNSNKSDSSTSKPSQSTEKPAESKPAHQHTWVDHKATRTVTEYVHHDAVYQDVTTPAVTQKQIQCLGCHKWFTSAADLDNHAFAVQIGQESGDPSRCGSTSYDAEREVVITPAKTEHKLVKEAYDEPVQKTETYVDYQYCSGCGQHK